MHYNDLHRPVVVGTDGTAAALRGVRYAALEAKRLGVRLEIVHVVPGYLPTGPLPLMPDDSLQAFGREVLERSLEASRAAIGDAGTIVRLVIGSRVSSLVEASSRAQLLVLASQALTLTERVWTGATVVGVCSRAMCPVVVVPDDWTPCDSHAVSPVLIGLKFPRQASELMRDAFALSSSLGADLVVLHGWKLPSVYDDIVTTRIDPISWQEDQEALIRDELAGYRSTYPEVHVRIDVVHGRPADSLVQASRGASRILISRPVHGGYFHHLGAVARAVMRESHCPVEIVPSVPVNSEDSEPQRAYETLPS